MVARGRAEQVVAEGRTFALLVDARDPPGSGDDPHLSSALVREMARRCERGRRARWSRLEGVGVRGDPDAGRTQAHGEAAVVPGPSTVTRPPSKALTDLGDGFEPGPQAELVALVGGG
jgi:hypothetical protein